MYRHTVSGSPAITAALVGLLLVSSAPARGGARHLLPEALELRLPAGGGGSQDKTPVRIWGVPGGHEDGSLIEGFGQSLAQLRRRLRLPENLVIVPGVGRDGGFEEGDYPDELAQVVGVQLWFMF